MYSFLICIAALILGYIVYGRFVDKIFGPNPKASTPCVTKFDNVDYIPMPTWKVYMIQFLNIAGTGPIFGAIMGAKFGPSCYLWIVFGCIFAGAVHDYLSGMISIRNGGIALPDIIGKYLGGSVKKFMLILTLLLLLLTGAVFIYSPAIILTDLTGKFIELPQMTVIYIWIGIIFIYYLCATLLPINRIIGKIYPVFAVSLLFMAVALMVCLIMKWPSIPEFWQGLGNRGPSVGLTGQDIFPCLFITVACGALSGFHATQSPLMARCMKNEKYGRPVFYGAMICEGVVALIWAAVASYFFFDGGAEAVGSTISADAPSVVTKVAMDWLGIAGGILAIFGVVAAPISTGDTAFRSARLIITDFIQPKTKHHIKPLEIAIPIFIVAGLILWFNISNKDGFNMIWRYFGWANQSIACITLWALTAFLAKERRGWSFMITLVPACIMTSVCLTYISVAQIGLNLPNSVTPYLASGIALVCLILFCCWKRRCPKVS